jgi:hypothetical protein
MLDRRHTSHPRSRYGSAGSKDLISIQSVATAHKKLTTDLEVVVSRHFIETYYRFLLLPNCHRAFYDGWIHDIQELMVTDESLRYSVLANAASHIHNMDTNPGMQSLSLQYYSKSITGLNNILVQANNPFLKSCNGFLTSVMLLYLHGVSFSAFNSQYINLMEQCMGKGTYLDIPPHLHAAMRVLTLRFFETRITILRPFDQLAIESVLYQIFLTSTALWSDQAPLLEFDLQFWRKAELLLEQSVLYPNGPHSLNSPVLGVPVALFRLAIQAKQLCQHSTPGLSSELERLRVEISDWEAIVLAQPNVAPAYGEDAFNKQQAYYDGATHLYILIASLLLEQASTNLGTPRIGQNLLPETVPRNSWQIQKALHILRMFKDDSDWSSCYMGNWPVYTLGFFLDHPDDIRLVNNEMDRRWTCTKFMQIRRFQDDLVAAWNERNLLSATLHDTTQ